MPVRPTSGKSVITAGAAALGMLVFKCSKVYPNFKLESVKNGHKAVLFRGVTSILFFILGRP